MAQGMTGTKAKTTVRKSDTYRWFWDALDEYLSKKNLKQTRQRRGIIELFINLNRHLSAEELHEEARRDGHNVGLATIYRTLNLLAEAGLAEQKSFGENRFVYEVATPGAHHDHIICIDCGAVIEFENDEIERLQERVAAMHDFRLKAHRLDLFGHCLRKECDRKVRPN